LDLILVETEVWIGDPAAFEQLDMDLRGICLRRLPSVCADLFENGSYGGLALLPRPIGAELEVANVGHGGKDEAFETRPKYEPVLSCFLQLEMRWIGG
jgi:hypothetical protein